MICDGSINKNRIMSKGARMDRGPDGRMIERYLRWKLFPEHVENVFRLYGLELGPKSSKKIS